MVGATTPHGVGTKGLSVLHRVVDRGAGEAGTLNRRGGGGGLGVVGAIDGRGSGAVGAIGLGIGHCFRG